MQLSWPNNAVLPLHPRELRRRIRHMALAGPCEEPGECILLRDADMAKLNEKYLHCPGPTNCLAFPVAGKGESGLVLSLDALRRECLLYGQESGEHCIRLLAHGLAHLAGFEHGPVMEHFCARLEQAGRTE
jgi:probable rRNA maturation factor